MLYFKNEITSYIWGKQRAFLVKSSQWIMIWHFQHIVVSIRCVLRTLRKYKFAANAVKLSSFFLRVSFWEFFLNEDSSMFNGIPKIEKYAENSIVIICCSTNNGKVKKSRFLSSFCFRVLNSSNFLKKIDKSCFLQVIILQKLIMKFLSKKCYAICMVSRILRNLIYLLS